MGYFPIGAIVDSFRMETHEAIKKASEMGIEGLQIYCTNGIHAPENFSKADRRELLNFTKGHGLKFSAICGDLGSGFTDSEKNPERIERSKRIIDMCEDLETNVVTTHIGVVPEDKNHERYKILQEACYELAQYADSVGFKFAVETGPERSIVLKEFLDSLGSTGLSVNLDPANLVMVTGDDPVEAVYNLRKYIVHTHAKDGVRLLKADPEIVYGMMHPVPAEFQGKKFYQELPLGQGSVDFPAYLAALKDIGYKGFLTIERECGDNPAGDIGVAVDHLRKCMEGLG